MLQLPDQMRIAADIEEAYNIGPNEQRLVCAFLIKLYSSFEFSNQHMHATSNRVSTRMLAYLSTRWNKRVRARMYAQLYTRVTE